MAVASPPHPSREPALCRCLDDPDAFEAFYERYRGRVLGFFGRRVGEQDAVADLTAETFTIALERRRQFRGGTQEEEQGWLFSIARSQLSHFWRHGEVERRALARLDSERGRDAARQEDVPAPPELPAHVASALRQLSAEQAYCVRQRVLSERSYRELAGELEVSEDVVRARVSRGLRALGSALERH